MLNTSLLGTRVLDLTRLAPGPYASLVLVDLGAEIIKIEYPSFGDPLRYSIPAHCDSRPVLFDLLNRGKKSLTLNLKAPEGKAIFEQLAGRADVLMEGFRPGVMQRLGLDYEALRGMNPRLVYVSLSGYGQNGPYSRRACHDLNCLALAGLLDLTGRENGPPTLSAVPWADMASGLWAAVGIVTALLQRQHTGHGQYLDIAMLDSVAALTIVPVADWLATDIPPRRGQTSLSGKLACYNVYETADGKYMSLGALEPHFWEAFCAAVGREDWVARHYDADQASLQAEVAALFRTRPQADWIELFAGHDCCCEPVLALNEALTHPQAVRRELLIQGQLGTPLAKLPAQGCPAPELGEHTAVILAELGYTDRDVQRLRQAGVV